MGLPIFFLTKSYLGTSTAALIMVFMMLPFFLLALYEKNGQPLEKVAENMINVMLLRPKRRVYRTNNFYSALMKQNSLDTEVYGILHGKAYEK